MPGTSILQVSGFESIFKDHPSHITVELENIFPDDSYTTPFLVSLDAFDVVDPDAKFVLGTREGDRSLDLQFAAYKGRIGENDWINLSFSRIGLMGWIRLSERTYSIQPVQSNIFNAVNREHIIYEISNQNQEGSWCGVNTESLPPEIKQLMASLDRNTLKSSNIQLTAKLAVETDYETYESFGKDSLLTTSYLLSIVAAVSQIYVQELNIKLVVVFSRVWTTPNDPYTLKGFSLFSELYNYWTSYMQDVERGCGNSYYKRPRSFSRGNGFSGRFR